MNKARIVVLIIAVALACVVLTTRTANGDKREPVGDQIEEIKGEREEHARSDQRRARRARIFHGLDLTEDQKQQMAEIRRQFREDMKALHMAHKRGVLSDNILNGLLQELAHLPDMMGTMLRNQKQYEVLARQYFRKSDFLYLGRGINYPLAMEGALKLKEVSYIHAEGYPAGEMKHGPISLIDENMPVLERYIKLL